MSLCPAPSPDDTDRLRKQNCAVYRVHTARVGDFTDRQLGRYAASLGATQT